MERDTYLAVKELSGETSRQFQLNAINSLTFTELGSMEAESGQKKAALVRRTGRGEYPSKVARHATYRSEPYPRRSFHHYSNNTHSFRHQSGSHSLNRSYEGHSSWRSRYSSESEDRDIKRRRHY